MEAKVSIIMGSTSDLDVMAKAAKLLEDFEIPFEMNALSAHRTPEAVEIFAKGAKAKGIKVIIAGAGMAAHLPGVIAAMLFVSVPFLIDAAREGFESVDPHLEYVARTLGSSAWSAFWRVTFPMAWRSIISGLIMMWSRGISEFGAVVILTYHPMIAPVLLYERFQSFGLEYALPVARRPKFIPG